MSEIVLSGNIRKEEEARKTEEIRAEFEGMTAEEIRELVLAFPLTKGLDSKHVDALIAISKRMAFDKDDVLIQQGSTEHNLFFILRGRAQIIMSNHADEAVGMADAGAGETLGEVSLLIDAPHSASVIALEPMVVIRISRLALGSLMASDPELAARLWHRLAQLLGDRLRDSNIRYLKRATEVQDIADELIQTRPLTEEEKAGK
jgi:CRP-like cAMP-binding protein